MMPELHWLNIMWDKKRRLIRPWDHCHAIRIPDWMILVTAPTSDLSPFRLSASTLHLLLPAGAISEQLCVLMFVSEPLCKVQSFLIPLGEKSQFSRRGLSMDISTWWTSEGSYILTTYHWCSSDLKGKHVIHLSSLNYLSFRESGL